MAQDGGIDAPEPARAMKGQPLTAAWEIFQKKLAGMSANGDGMPAAALQATQRQSTA